MNKKIKDSFYDYSFNNDVDNLNKIINQYKIIPDIIKDQDELLFLCVSLIMEKNENSLISIIENSFFDVSFNDFEFINTLCSTDFYNCELKYYDLLKKVIGLPNIYNNINEIFINKIINECHNYPSDPRLLILFENLKKIKTIDNF